MEDALNFAILRSWFVRGAYWEKVAYALWLTILVFVCVRTFIDPEKKTVYTIFSSSARLWCEQGELYDPYRPHDVRDGYRYHPTVTVLFVPFALMRDDFGGVVWRLFNVAPMFISLSWFVRSLFPDTFTSKHYAWLLLVAAPLSLQSVGNGQANPLVIAAMLGTVAAVKEERWSLACALLSIAFIFKIYPLALGLVLAVLYPRQIFWRLPITIAASLLAAFLFQEPGYVLDQYQKWIALVASEDRSATLLDHMYRDLWLLIHLYDLPISRSAYAIVQATSGVGVALLCWRRQRDGWTTPELLISTLAVTTTWMMLLGPATESSTFILLAPSLAWSVVSGFEAFEWRHVLLWASCAGFLLAVVLGGFRMTMFAHTHGVHPWATLLYAGYLVMERNPALPILRSGTRQSSDSTEMRNSGEFRYEKCA